MATARRLDTSRISFGEMVAGISAVVLLIDMFLPWYGASVKASIGRFSASRSENATAWEAFGGRDILLLLIVLAVLTYVLLRALDALPALPFDGAMAVLALGGLAVLMVLIGIIHIPTGDAGNISDSFINVDFSRKFGLFLGFLASCGIAYGGWAAFNEGRRFVAPAAAGPGGGLTGAGAVTPAGTPSVPPTEPLGTPPTPGGSTPPIGTTPGGTTPPAATTPGGTTPPTTAPGAGPPSTTPPGPATPSSPPPSSVPGAGATGAPGAATPAAQPEPPAGPKADWYPDPHGQARLRWWDGSQWTDQTAD